MDAFFGAELPQALDNTVAIAERCCVSLDLKTGSYQLPLSLMHQQFQLFEHM